jgi:hypothetical protein
MKRWKLCLFAFVIGSISANFARGQVTSGAIQGTVTDSQDAAVAGATVTVRQKQTGARRVAETQSDGLYRVESLAAGEYEIEASWPGFGAEIYRLNLRSGEFLTVDFQLEVGRLTERWS